MMASNFAFLNKEFPVLANLGELAEKYCYSDPNSCLMKLGMIGETIVNLMFLYDKLTPPADNIAVKKIDMLQAEGLLSKDLVGILHALRKARNKAAHQNYASTEACLVLNEMAFSLCEWFMQTYGDWNYKNQDYIRPELHSEADTQSINKIAEEAKEAQLAAEAEEAASKAEAVAKEDRQKRAMKIANQRHMYNSAPALT